MTHIQINQYKPGRMVSHLKDTRFFRTLGARKAAVISGLFTTFKSTRFTGLELFDNNTPALLKIMSTTKYAEVQTVAVEKVGERDLDAIKSIAKNPGLAELHSLALHNLIKHGEFDFTVNYFNKARKEIRPVILQGLAEVLDTLENQKALELIAGSHASSETRKAAAAKITDNDILSEICKSWDNKDGEVKLALGKISPLEMVGLFNSNAKPDNKKLILEKLVSMLDTLDNQRALRLLADSHTNPETCKAAAAKINDQTIITEICNNWSNRNGVVETVLDKLTPAELVTACNATKHAEVKNLIMDRLAGLLGQTIDQDVLALLCYHGQPEVRAKAIKFVKSTEKLYSIATYCPHPDVVSVAVKQLDAEALWKARQATKFSATKAEITARLGELVGKISDEKILHHLLRDAISKKVTVTKRSQKPGVLYELVSVIEDHQLENMRDIGNRLCELIDVLQDNELIALTIAFTDDKQIVDKVIMKLRNKPNWLAGVVLLTNSAATRDEVLGMIEGHENALTLVAREKDKLEGTSQKAVDLLGKIYGKLTILEAFELVGTRCTNEKARHAVIHNLMVLSYDMGQELVGASYDGYHVGDAICQREKIMRKYEQVLINIRKGTTYPDTKKYADSKQDELIADWNAAVNQSNINMRATALEMKLRNFQRIMSGGYSGSNFESNAFQGLRMPGEGILEGIENVVGRLF